MLTISMTPLPRVFNCRDVNCPPDAVLVDRTTAFGNPFHISAGMTRKRAIDEFEKMLLNDSELMKKVQTELRGKDLKCWCHPKACHPKVLLKYANSLV